MIFTVHERMWRTMCESQRIQKVGPTSNMPSSPKTSAYEVDNMQVWTWLFPNSALLFLYNVVHLITGSDYF